MPRLLPLLAILVAWLLAACTATSGYDPNPTMYMSAVPAPRASPIPYGTPGYPSLPPPSMQPAPVNPTLPYRPGPTTPSTPTQPSLYYNTPQYNLDPAHPYNRGQWTIQLMPNGQPMTVWSTEPTPPPGAGPLPQDYPVSPGYTQPETRWNPYLRR